MRVFEADLGETTTKGAVPIIVNTYVVWKIAEPLVFFNSVGTIKEAENKLLSQLSDTQNKVIGRHDFAEFVNSDPAKIKFEDILLNPLFKEAVLNSNNYIDLKYYIPIKTDLNIKIPLCISYQNISEKSRNSNICLPP